MSQRIDTVKRIFETLAQTGSMDELLSLVTDDTVTRNAVPGWTPFGGEYRGKEGLLEYFRRADTVLDMFNLQARDYFESGDKVVVLGDEMLRIKASGQEFFSEWCTVFTFHGETLSSIFVLEDHSTLSIHLAALAERQRA